MISNLTMWIITTLKGFRIGPSMPEITMVWKVTLGMKHPVGRARGTTLRHFSAAYKWAAWVYKWSARAPRARETEVVF